MRSIRIVLQVLLFFVQVIEEITASVPRSEAGWLSRPYGG